MVWISFRKKKPVTVVGNDEVKYRNVDRCSSPYLELFIGSLKVDAFVDIGAWFSAISPIVCWNWLVENQFIVNPIYNKNFNVSWAVGMETYEVKEQVELKFCIRGNPLL